VALPWYALVTAETKADFLRGFLLTHNVGRYLEPMENHRGPAYYYLLVLLVGFAPWSVFLGLAGWNSVRELRAPGGESAPANRFLLVWTVVPLVFFSFAGTKLPNYILPIYPAVALLCGRVLQCWVDESAPLPRWAISLALVSFALVGVITMAVLLVAGGLVPLPVLKGRFLPGLEDWAALGVVPVAGWLVAGWFARRQHRLAAIGAVSLSAIAFVGLCAAGIAPVIDRHKAPRNLARDVRAGDPGAEVRIACYEYYQPSLVFYCRREVVRLADEAGVKEFLSYPFENYLLLPGHAWEGLAGRVDPAYRVLGRHYDLYRNAEVFVVSNRRHGP
jgi:4-amino-4-deoxy-L-arabinose transferase-like glycosyltransferase